MLKKNDPARERERREIYLSSTVVISIFFQMSKVEKQIQSLTQASRVPMKASDSERKEFSGLFDDDSDDDGDDIFRFVH